MSRLDIPAIKDALFNILVDEFSTPIDSAGTKRQVMVYKNVRTATVFPCIVIPPAQTVDYSRTSQRGLDVATFDLVLLTGKMSPVAINDLDLMMSGTGQWSIVRIVSENKKLGGTVAAAKITEMTTGAYSVSVGAEPVIGAEITLEVIA